MRLNTMGDPQNRGGEGDGAGNESGQGLPQEVMREE